MRRDPSRVILLTATGVGAIAVIRLAGPDALAFLTRHFTGRAQDGRPVHGHLRDGEHELDDPVVLWDSQRQVADVCTHGGKWVVHSVLDLAQREGFVLGDTADPVVADADDPLEQEILRALPLARTREAIATLLNQQQAWKELTSPSPADRQRIIADRSLQWLLHPPRIAIIGVPNAGKSTLANAIFGQQRSIVTDTPGTTRDYVEEYANLGGMAARLVDTPGLRATANSIEAAAIGVSLSEIAGADLLILLLDPTQAPEPQRELARRYPDALQVSGKSDLAAQVAELAISAATGEGLAGMEGAVRKHFGCETLPHSRPCLWTASQRERFASLDFPFR